MSYVANPYSRTYTQDLTGSLAVTGDIAIAPTLRNRAAPAAEWSRLGREAIGSVRRAIIDRLVGWLLGLALSAVMLAHAQILEYLHRIWNNMPRLW